MAENYILLERTELNASAASVTFANIPQTGYTDLKVVVSARGSSAAINAAIYWTFNGSSAANYSWRQLQGNSSTASSSSSTGQTYFRAGYVPDTSATASTFGSAELYIPNYAGSTAKSISIDSAQENNSGTAGEALLHLVAANWSLTNAITSITAVLSSGDFLTGSTFSLYGLAALGTTPAIAPKAYGGNVIDFDGTYWIHTFTSSGTFTPQVGLTCDYLVVAGAGGGGGHNAGGGGAGGLRSTVTSTGGGGSLESALSVASGTAYTVTVGAGGAGGNDARGVIGNNSVFSSITSTGGAGGGGNNSSQPAVTGGSGGGGTQGVAGSAGTANQGFAGGNSSGSNTGGGGGGAGAVGAANSSTNGGNGGNGVAVSITGTSVTYAGGGGGSSFSGSQGSGGSGGGGGANNSAAGVAGDTNKGSGGGGTNRTTAAGGNGGSGIVIIRYTAA